MMMTLRLSSITLSRVSFTSSVFSAQLLLILGGENSRQFYGFRLCIVLDHLLSPSEPLNHGTCPQSNFLKSYRQNQNFICYRTFTIVGLLLVALGSGGIKPCVSAFGGEQFKLPQQAAQLAVFFSLFYFSVNAGSLISTSITPILRDVACFGMVGCFPLAFGVPAVLMIVSIVIFVGGKFLYKIVPPQGNMLVKVFQCIAVRFFF
jgi:dipeptide/tripeptide permease